VGREADRLDAIDADRSGALLDQPHDAFEHRAASSAVSSEECHHLAAPHVEVDSVQDIGFTVERVHIRCPQEIR
jgi:hypothetical protein